MSKDFKYFLFINFKVGNGLNNLDFENPVLKQAARALSANLNKFGILRIGGSLEDQINYNFTAETEHCDPYPMEKNTTKYVSIFRPNFFLNLSFILLIVSLLFINANVQKRNSSCTWFFYFCLTDTGENVQKWTRVLSTRRWQISSPQLYRLRHCGFNDGCFTKMKRSQLQKFAKETNLKIIFGLNGLIGRKQTGPTDWSGQWDPTQAKKLFDEMIETGFIDQIWGLELGNEIYGSHGVQVQIKNS